MDGYTGIALVFLLAYEHFKLIEYKNLAEKILGQFSEYPVFADYSILKGMSGLGLVYLEATKICDNPEWKKES